MGVWRGVGAWRWGQEGAKGWPGLSARRRALGLSLRLRLRPRLSPKLKLKLKLKPLP